MPLLRNGNGSTGQLRENVVRGSRATHVCGDAFQHPMRGS